MAQKLAPTGETASPAAGVDPTGSGKSAPPQPALPPVVPARHTLLEKLTTGSFMCGPSWVPRYFVTKQGRFGYCRDADTSSRIDVAHELKLRGVDARVVPGGTAGRQYVFSVRTAEAERTYYVSAPDEAERDAWVAALAEYIASLKAGRKLSAEERRVALVAAGLNMPAPATPRPVLSSSPVSKSAAKPEIAIARSKLDSGSEDGRKRLAAHNTASTDAASHASAAAEPNQAPLSAGAVPEADAKTAAASPSPASAAAPEAAAAPAPKAEQQEDGASTTSSHLPDPEAVPARVLQRMPRPPADLPLALDGLSPVEVPGSAEPTDDEASASASAHSRFVGHLLTHLWSRVRAVNSNKPAPSFRTVREGAESSLSARLTGTPWQLFIRSAVEAMVAFRFRGPAATDRVRRWGSEAVSSEQDDDNASRSLTDFDDGMSVPSSAASLDAYLESVGLATPRAAHPAEPVADAMPKLAMEPLAASASQVPVSNDQDVTVDDVTKPEDPADRSSAAAAAAPAEESSDDKPSVAASAAAGENPKPHKPFRSLADVVHAVAPGIAVAQRRESAGIEGLPAGTRSLAMVARAIQASRAASSNPALFAIMEVRRSFTAGMTPTASFRSVSSFHSGSAPAGPNTDIVVPEATSVASDASSLATSPKGVNEGQIGESVGAAAAQAAVAVAAATKKAEEEAAAAAAKQAKEEEAAAAVAAKKAEEEEAAAAAAAKKAEEEEAAAAAAAKKAEEEEVAAATVAQKAKEDAAAAAAAAKMAEDEAVVAVAAVVTDESDSCADVTAGVEGNSAEALDQVATFPEALAAAAESAGDEPGEALTASALAAPEDGGADDGILPESLGPDLEREVSSSGFVAAVRDLNNIVQAVFAQFASGDQMPLPALQKLCTDTFILAPPRLTMERIGAVFSRLIAEAAAATADGDSPPDWISSRAFTAALVMFSVLRYPESVDGRFDKLVSDHLVPFASAHDLVEADADAGPAKEAQAEAAPSASEGAASSSTPHAEPEPAAAAGTEAVEEPSAEANAEPEAAEQVAVTLQDGGWGDEAPAAAPADVEAVDEEPEVAADEATSAAEAAQTSAEEADDDAEDSSWYSGASKRLIASVNGTSSDSAAVAADGDSAAASDGEPGARFLAAACVALNDSATGAAADPAGAPADSSWSVDIPGVREALKTDVIAVRGVFEHYALRWRTETARNGRPINLAAKDQEPSSWWMSGTEVEAFATEFGISPALMTRAALSQLASQVVADDMVSGGSLPTSTTGTIIGWEHFQELLARVATKFCARPKDAEAGERASGLFAMRRLLRTMGGAEAATRITMGPRGSGALRFAASALPVPADE